MYSFVHVIYSIYTNLIGETNFTSNYEFGFCLTGQINIYYLKNTHIKLKDHIGGTVFLLSLAFQIARQTDMCDWLSLLPSSVNGINCTL